MVYLISRSVTVCLNDIPICIKYRPADMIPYRFLQGNCVTCFVHAYASFLDEFFHAVQRVTVRQGKHSLR